MRNIILAATAVLALWSCGDSNSPELYDDTRKPTEEFDGAGSISKLTSPHFITEYVTVSKIWVKTNTAGGLDLRVGGNCYSTFKDKSYKHYETAKYFSELYGDTQYNEKVSGWQHPALAYPIDKMTISCAMDFDKEHPAGTPLDDIVSLDFSTYDKFIKSGYKSLNDNPWYYDAEEELFLLPLNGINADVTKLAKVILEIDYYSNSWFNFFARLKFASQPTEPGEYTFTLEMTTNGETLKTEFTHTF